MELYLIRHAESEANIQKVFSGSFDVPLTELGRAQAKLLRKRLEGIPFDKAFSSDLTRAQETLRLATDTVPVVSSPLLRERGFGIFEGKPYADLYAALEECKKNKDEFSPEGGENFEAVIVRLEQFWSQYLKQFDGRVIIAAHGSLNRIFLRWLLGLTLDQQLELHQNNTCVNILHGSKPGSFESEVINCTNHL